MIFFLSYDSSMFILESYWPHYKSSTIVFVQIYNNSLKRMFRHNKPLKQKQNKFNVTKIQTYNYRNAIYQGEVNKDQCQREGKGIIYIPDNHHFIACNSFNSNQLNGHALFFHSHSKYHYGQWKNNQPQGIAIFRMNEVLIIAEYSKGTLLPNSKVLLVFEQYNFGVIVDVFQDNQWQINQKKEVLCSQHLEELIQMCNFQKESIPNLLVKYLNNFMVSDDKNFIKLRLINNIYYRYGYDQGLAIIFDDSHKIVSVGVHNKSELTSYGVKFNSQKLGNKVEEGIFDGHSTFIFDQPNRPLQKIGQLYCKSHLSSVNFQNQVYKDPSEPFFNYFEELLQSQPIVQLVANIIHSPSDFESFRKMMIEEPVKDESYKKYQKLQFPDFQKPSFKKQPEQLQKEVELLVEPKYQQEIRKEQVNSVVWENSHRSVETFQFERLSEKNRLDILKKQLYINLSHKNLKEQSRTRKPKIINMSPVSVYNVQNSRKIQKRVEKTEKPNEIYIYEPQMIAKQVVNANLDKHLDIRINDYPEKQEEKQFKSVMSKSRKKIFEQLPNVIKDYSPQTSPSLSPFRSKMRSKIFPKTPDKSQKSRSRSSRKIFPLPKTPEKLDMSKIKMISSKEPQSPHRIYQGSIQKSQSSSHIKPYPITMNRQVKEKERNIPEEKMQQNDQNYKEGKQDKIKWINHLETKSKQQWRQPQEENRRKSNTVYRNTLKSDYGDYVFEPIDIKETGNRPYLRSNQTSSNKNFERDLSKKSIEETNPFKRQKMSSYMDSTPYGYRGSQRFADFKRRVNYF